MKDIKYDKDKDNNVSKGNSGNTLYQNVNSNRQIDNTVSRMRIIARITTIKMTLVRRLGAIRRPGTSNTDPLQADATSDHAWCQLMTSQRSTLQRGRSHHTKTGRLLVSQGQELRSTESDLLKRNAIPGSGTSVRRIGLPPILSRTAARTTSDCTRTPSVPLANEATYPAPCDMLTSSLTQSATTQTKSAVVASIGWLLLADCCRKPTVETGSCAMALHVASLPVHQIIASALGRPASCFSCPPPPPLHPPASGE